MWGWKTWEPREIVDHVRGRQEAGSGRDPREPGRDRAMPEKGKVPSFLQSLIKKNIFCISLILNSLISFIFFSNLFI